MVSIAACTAAPVRSSLGLSRLMEHSRFNIKIFGCLTCHLAGQL